MKFELQLYKEDGTEDRIVGTNFCSTNTLIKAIKCLEEVEKEKDTARIINTVIEVAALIIPNVTVDEIRNGADFADVINLIKSIVAKANGIEPSKN